MGAMMDDRRKPPQASAALAPPAMATLAALLDTLIPPSKDGRLPGAGAIGVGDHVVLAMQADAATGELVSRGLDELDACARSAGADGFAQLDEDARSALVQRFQNEQKDFFECIVLHACTGYYQHERVVGALGLEARPPFPKGYEVAAIDPDLLEPVRKRAPMYRKC
jgi:hypothetical protein